MAIEPPACPKQAGGLHFGRQNSPLPAVLSRCAAGISPIEIPCGNQTLTTISVWLETKRRAESPRFDTLAGEASPGFGRASHVMDHGISRRR
jgi:hypothetical protein